MRSYSVQWASYDEGVAVQASWSEAKGDFDNLAFISWNELETIAGWRSTVDQTPSPLVGEGYIAVADAQGSVAIYTNTASKDFAPNQFLTWLNQETLAWLLDEARDDTFGARPFAALLPAILDKKFVADAKRDHESRARIIRAGLLDLSVTTK